MLDPTAVADEVAARVRRWYEANRESWWDRHRSASDRSGRHADEFMLRLIGQVDEARRGVADTWQEPGPPPRRHLNSTGKILLVIVVAVVAAIALVLLWLVPSRFGPVGW